MPIALPAQPALALLPDATFALGGEVGRRLAAVTEQWLLPAPFANPAMLEMFRDRDRQPYRAQVPWAGEFAGKYLTHLVQIHRLTRDPRLRQQLAWFVGELCALQAEDGYLGPWPQAWRLRAGAPNCQWPWDAWGHYHVMLGLLLWHRDSGDARALACARRIGDLFCRRFLDGGESLHATGCHEMNQAPVHALALLHQVTGEPRYRAMAERIVAEFALAPAGDYLRAPLAGKEFWETPKPRWESLHPIMGLVELYYITGDAPYREAFTRLWWSMLRGDRHNNGGFTSGEKATGNPFDRGAIETCCTIAWMAMSVEMLRLTGESVVADELEFSFYNSGLGMMSPSGRWVTYDTPMEGQRLASAHHIVFQARAGQPELNCCSVNGPRALGLLSDWALMGRVDGLALHYFGPGTLAAPLPGGGGPVTLRVLGDYPRHERVEVVVEPARAGVEFTLALRIPAWSARTAVAVNGTPCAAPVAPGRYCELRRAWQTGDRVAIAFDFRPHFWFWREQGLEQPHWECDWQLFGPAPRLPGDEDLNKAPRAEVGPALAGLADLPATLRINGRDFAPTRVRSDGGLIEGRRLFPAVGGQPVLIGFTTFDSPAADELRVRFAPDWWVAWYVNGVCVYDNHDGIGDQDPAFGRTLCAHLPLRAGRNVIAFRLSGGSSHGCWLSLGREPTAAEVARQPPRPRVGLASVYRGPLLLAYDPTWNAADPRELPALDPAALPLTRVEGDTWLKPWLLLETAGTDGRVLRLGDFASAGAAGRAYRTWLPVRWPANAKCEFSATNPLRTWRPEP